MEAQSKDPQKFLVEMLEIAIGMEKWSHDAPWGQPQVDKFTVEVGLSKALIYACQQLVKLTKSSTDVVEAFSKVQAVDKLIEDRDRKGDTYFWLSTFHTSNRSLTNDQVLISQVVAELLKRGKQVIITPSGVTHAEYDRLKYEGVEMLDPVEIANWITVVP